MKAQMKAPLHCWHRHDNVARVTGQVVAHPWANASVSANIGAANYTSERLPAIKWRWRITKQRV